MLFQSSVLQILMLGIYVQCKGNYNYIQLKRTVMLLFVCQFRQHTLMNVHVVLTVSFSVLYTARNTLVLQAGNSVVISWS